MVVAVVEQMTPRVLPGRPGSAAVPPIDEGLAFQQVVEHHVGVEQHLHRYLSSR